MLPCGVVWFQMWLIWNAIPRFLTLKLIPPVDVSWKSFHSRVLCFFYECFPLSLLFFCISDPSFWSFHFTRLPFLSLYGFCSECVCVRPSMGVALAEQQSIRTHTCNLDTHCIQLTAHSEHFHAHTHAKTYTHTQSFADRSHTRQSELHFTLWAYDSISSRSHYRVTLHHPTTHGTQREDDKLSIRPPQGNFPAVSTHSETRLSCPHVGSRGALIWLCLCHGRTRVELLFSTSLCSC